MTKIRALIAALAILPVFALANIVSADSPGQLTGGPQVFEAKNITTGGSYSDNTSVACNEVVQYSAMLHNAAFGGLTNVQASANLASGTFTAIPAEGATYGTSDTTSVTVASGGTLAYVSGSTQLYNSSGVLIRSLPDGITTGSVNIGDIPGSTTEFVNFQAKVNCPAPAPTPTPTPKPTPTAAGKAAALPSTGPGDVAGLFVGTSVLGAAGHYIWSRRRF